MKNDTDALELRPAGTLGSVTLINAIYNEYGNWKTIDDAFLLPGGRVRIDGIVAAPGDVLYIDPASKRFSREVPETLYTTVRRELDAYINNMIAQSAGINRSVSRTPLSLPRHTGDELFDLFSDPGREAWKAARYPNARPGWSSDIRPLEWIDSVTEIHDPDKLADAIVQKHINERFRFGVGGFLHIDGVEAKSGLDTERAAAIRQYAACGGRLGKSVLDAFAVNSADDPTLDGSRPF